MNDRRKLRAIGRIVVPIFIIAGLSIPVASAKPSIKANEFRRSAGGLVCITQDYEDTEPPYLRCLRIGPIFIDQKAEDAERALGNPWKVIEKDESIVVKIYAIKTDNRVAPYWVLTIKKGLVEAIQLTGADTDANYSFSSISLGDGTATVERTLGNPTLTQHIPEIDGVMWSYRPFPISIEIKNAKVYSIRLGRKSP